MSEPSAQQPAGDDDRPRTTRNGPGRLLIAVYGLFALSATARAVTQIATQFHRAPLAYLLSAFAGLVYILATVTLTRGSRNARRIAAVSCTVEFLGVIAVGTWSLLDKATFPDATVWSGYGSGYGYVPLVLPVFGLLWLRYWSRRTRAAAPAPAAGDQAAAGERGRG
jgi:cytochrome bd-type quinol oxidase subunit 2